MTSFAFLAAAARQAQAVGETAHRPWPLPDRPWLQAQTREDVLLAHWRVGLPEASRLLPPGLPLDTFEGEAWLGLVAFRLANVRLRGLPALPRGFPQLEIRTYVTVEGRPGVWIVSIDAGSRLLVEAAKRAHRLPAYRARVRAAADGETRYEVVRDGLAFRSRHRPAGDPRPAQPGTLEHFLVERYCLYTADGGRLYRAELHHAPWLLAPAEGEVEEATLAPLPLEGRPHLLCAASQDVLVWPLEEV